MLESKAARPASPAGCPPWPSSHPRRWSLAQNFAPLQTSQLGLHDSRLKSIAVAWPVSPVLLRMHMPLTFKLMPATFKLMPCTTCLRVVALHLRVVPSLLESSKESTNGMINSPARLRLGLCGHHLQRARSGSGVASAMCDLCFWQAKRKNSAQKDAPLLPSEVSMGMFTPKHLQTQAAYKLPMVKGFLLQDTPNSFSRCKLSS